jgi:hypothetical protein
MSKPEKKFRCGPITASIFAEARVVNGQMVKFYSTCIDKAYKDGDQWKHATAFAPEDLPKVALLATEVYRYLRVKTSDDDTADHDMQT